MKPNIKKEIPVPVDWLKQLAKLSDRAQKDMDEWYDGVEKLTPESFSSLIGYTSSAKNLIKELTGEDSEDILGSDWEAISEELGEDGEE